MPQDVYTEPEAFYTDDVSMICSILEENWSLPMPRPNFYREQDTMVRNNNPGSIYIYSLGRNNQRYGTNYDAVKRTHRICIDVQNPENRQRHYDWLNEIYRILWMFRRAGKNKLKGWDYLEISNDNFKQGYVRFYHDAMEINLVREVKTIHSNGFGNNDDCDINDYEDSEGDYQ